MRLGISISCIKDGQARSAMALFWRWQSGAAASEDASPCSPTESMRGLARKRSGQHDFELEDYVVPSSINPESPEASTRDEAENYFSRTWATHKYPAVSPTSTSSSNHHNNKNNVQQQQQQEQKIALHLQQQPLPQHVEPLHRPPFLQPADSPAHHDPPTRRIWQHASHVANNPPQVTFVIASFNILASAHARQHRSLYPYVPNDLLIWSSRKRKLLQELDFCSPDIICLQEVDRFKDLEEDLASRGYVGLYKVRTGGMPDGCAIFWRKGRFQLLQERSFEFSMLGMRDNVAQLCVLQLTVPGAANNRSPSMFRTADQTQSHRLVVGNIHVLFNPKRGEIKLGQCRAFLEQVHNLSSIWHGAPVVIGGDFNSTPSSAVYEFLAKSELDLSNLDRRYLSGQVAKGLGSKGRKPGKDAPVQGTLEEMLKRSLRAQLASQEGLEATLCTNDEKAEEPLSGTGPPRDSPAELLAQRCIQEIGSCSTQSLNGSFSEEQTATTSQIHLKTSSLSTVESSVPQEEFIKSMPYDSLDLKQRCFDNGNPSSASKVLKKEHAENGQDKHQWDLEELRVATGKLDRTSIQHKLNLCSVYSEIQGQADTRDAKGEPLLTTCHKDFTGTVDYIWRNDGLKTMKVLDTVPLNAFVRNKGLPIKVWGSDHLAIACELAFTQRGK